jgi:hypothetical protein
MLAWGTAPLAQEDLFELPPPPPPDEEYDLEDGQGSTDDQQDYNLHLKQVAEFRAGLFRKRVVGAEAGRTKKLGSVGFKSFELDDPRVESSQSRHIPLPASKISSRTDNFVANSAHHNNASATDPGIPDTIHLLRSHSAPNQPLLNTTPKAASAKPSRAARAAAAIASVPRIGLNLASMSMPLEQHAASSQNDSGMVSLTMAAIPMDRSLFDPTQRGVSEGGGRGVAADPNLHMRGGLKKLPQLDLQVVMRHYVHLNKNGGTRCDVTLPTTTL